MHTLLHDAIKGNHVNMAERALRKFVRDFEKLYGAANVSFNVHLLMHLSASVRNWGHPHFHSNHLMEHCLNFSMEQRMC